jgi:hypothetical protein
LHADRYNYGHATVAYEHIYQDADADNNAVPVPDIYLHKYTVLQPDYYKDPYHIADIYSDAGIHAAQGELRRAAIH